MKRKKTEPEWYDYNMEYDIQIQIAMAHALKEFHRFLEEEYGWTSFHPLIGIKVREIREDFTLGKAYDINEIEEYMEKLFDCEPEEERKPTDGIEIQ